MLKPLTLALAAALLSACTVGPEYVRPDSELPAQFDQASEEATALAPASQVWSAFGDAELDALIARALEANTTIAQAAARFEETRALRGLSPYSLFPTVTAATDAERVNRGSTTISFAPRLAFASVTHLKPHGCASAALPPMMTTRSVFLISVQEFVIAPRPNVGPKLDTVGPCQTRA